LHPPAPSHATVAPTHTPELFRAAIAQAAALLRAGQVVALPTETVYGLAANALDAAAVRRIFSVKGRPANNPLIVHVADEKMARRCVAAWPEMAQRLARAFWPGPLTLVLPRSADIPDVVVAGGGTVGIRWPSHPVIQEVIRECGFPLAAPSANLSNRVSPTTAAHVRSQLGARISLIVDGGPCQIGIESTVLDLTQEPPRVLRPGMIHDQALAAVTGRLQSAEGSDSPILKSPGLLPKHYAPKAQLRIWAWENDRQLRELVAGSGMALSRVQVIAHSRVPAPGGFGRVSVIPHDAEAFARAIYAELHAGDEEGVGLVVVEALPDQPEWQAIADRLRRAAA
jgi:L-threonylcarbamoyladenylate synthase